MDYGKRLIGFLAALSLLVMPNLHAQYTDGEYYTDSKVKKRIFGLGAHVNPYYNNRRLLNNSLNPGTVFSLVDNASEGSWKVGGGIDVFITLNDNFEFVTGVSVSNYEFVYPQVQRGDFLDSLLNFRLEQTASFITIPIAISFRTELEDGWWLEFIPAWELSWLTDYEGYYERPEDNFSTTEDLQPLARDFYSWISISAGGTYRPFETWGYSLRLEGRYMLNSLIQRPDYPRETLYSIGANFGVQYRF